MRTVDLARAAGVSTQQIRNYEDAGVLPPVPRTASGYRSFDETHLRAALAYRALAAGQGPEAARAVMHALLGGDVPRALALLDAGHATLHAERAALHTTATALEAVAGSPPADRAAAVRLVDGDGAAGRRLVDGGAVGGRRLVDGDGAAGRRLVDGGDVRSVDGGGVGRPRFVDGGGVGGHGFVDGGRVDGPSGVDGRRAVDGGGVGGHGFVDGGRVDGPSGVDGRRAVDGGGVAGVPAGVAGVAELSVGELAAELGVRPSALRVWEAAGLLSPRRERVTGYRRYGPAEIRDARMIRMLRQNWYPLPQIGPILDGLRRTGSSAALREAVARRQAELTRRSAALLEGAAHLSHLVSPSHLDAAPSAG